MNILFTFYRHICTGLLWSCMLLLASFNAQAQNPISTVKGRVLGADDQPIPLANITIENTGLGTSTNTEGYFELKVPANRPIVLLVSHIEYKVKKVPLELQANETKEITVKLSERVTALEGVEVEGDQEEEQIREQAGAVALDVQMIQANVSAFGDFSQALAGQLGISGNNELSASYAVRGGSFDENLIYVNGMEVYRPFLVRAGQQEGLSFVNPDMVGSINFSAGGWQAKYGDKLSSVLDIDYKSPRRTAASFRASLLGASLSLEGISKNGKFTHVSGFRYKSARYLLNTLETDGQYLPRFGDFQTFMTYDLSGKNQPRNKTVLSFLGSYAVNRYEVQPQSRTTNFGTFQQAFRLFVGFVGAESLRYNTVQGGLRLSHKHTDRFTSHLTVSGMSTREREYIDLEGGYRLCDVDKNTASSTFNECLLTRGAGTLYEYSRNALDATIATARTQHELKISASTKMEFGARYDWQQTEDFLNEYSFSDSADYVTVGPYLESTQTVNTPKFSAYWQQTHYLDSTKTLSYGVRALYWALGEKFLLSPRAQFSIRPRWAKDFVWRFAAGIYHQPPFYREMRNFKGDLNRDLLPQSSLHLVAGFDYSLSIWGRPFKLLAEAYHKRLWNVVPYDADNVRLRYYANNNATAIVQGFDVRLSGEFIPNAESWFNISLLSAREDVSDDNRGWVRRPTDQLLTFGAFFQDHWPTDPTWRISVKLLYGTGFPYGPPNNYEQRATLKGGTTYNRIDMGLSKLLLLNSKRTVNNTKAIESIWIGLDVLNLVGVENNISFTWIPDFSGNEYAIPNSLSQRFFNLKLVIKY